VTIDRYDLTIEITKELIAAESPIRLAELSDEWQKIRENPDYLLSLTIPESWQQGIATIDNNLPIPDFQDTGFVGRETDRENLMDLILGPHPLITVTGEGGVGKTSLTLKCLEDIVSRKSPSLFEIVYWTSLKMTRLTSAGIQEITGAMTNEMQLLKTIIDSLGDSSEASTPNELFRDILEILDAFPTLLVIDNLETIDRDALRPLLIRIPRRSKILLTSRLAIGEIEIAYALQPMKPRDAVDLLRRTARLLNSDDLIKRENEEITNICKGLFFNPLAIRWFVQSYTEGRISLNDLLHHPRKLTEVMDFCFSNLYDALNERRRKYLRILVAVSKPLSEVQLALLSGVNDIEQVRIDLRYLVASNLLRRSRDTWGGGESTLWGVSDFAQRFIKSRERLFDDRSRLQEEYRQLMRARDQAQKFMLINPFRNRAIQARSTDEAMVVSLLNEALFASYEKKHERALRFVETACKLLPDFYEVWRVSAQVKNAAGKVLEAINDFEQALDLADGKSEPLLAHYAQFLQRHNELERAIQLLGEPIDRPNAAPELIAAMAWTQTLRKQFSEATELFERVYNQINTISGDQRSFILNQYATVLYHAAENERLRQNLDEAIKYIHHALIVVKEISDGYSINTTIIRTGQRCFKGACRIIAMRCLISEWEMIWPIADALSGYFLLAYSDTPEVKAFKESCPQITSRDDFRQILRPQKLVGSGELAGTLTKAVAEKGYCFIRGDNGREYFMYRTELKARIGWDKFCKLIGVRLRFKPEPKFDQPSNKKRRPVVSSVFVLASVNDPIADDWESDS